MLNEEMLMKVVYFDLNIQLRILGKQFTLCPLKVFCTSITLCSVVFITHDCLSATIGSMFEFVMEVTRVVIFVQLVLDLVNICFGPDDAELYESSSDSREKELEDKKQASNRVLFALIVTKGLTLLASLLVIHLENSSFLKTLFNIGVWLNSSKVLSIAILKHQIAKRLRRIRKMAETSAFLEEVVPVLREILKCNDKINRTYETMAAVFSISSSLRLLRYCYIIWFTYGVDESTGYSMGYHPVSTHLFHAVSYASALLLVECCASITDEVEEIKFELDVTMTARPCTKQQQKMITLLLLELHHKPVQLPALGLFTINRSSLAAVVATVISYMLVFIQFS